MTREEAFEQTSVIDVLQDLKDGLLEQMEKLYPHEVSYKSG